MTNKVVMVVSNSFLPDPRVHREANSLLANGFQVVVYAWDRKCTYPLNELLDGILIKRIRLKSGYGNFLKSLLTLPIFWVSLLPRIYLEKIDVIHCHDFDTVPVGLALKALRRKTQLVYDAHEYYAAMVADQTPSFICRLLRWVDSIFARTVDQVIIPCEARKRLYPEAKAIFIVPNTPKSAEISAMHGKKKFSVFYAGNLAKENGILVAAQAVQCLPNTELVLAGEGPLSSILKNMNNIRYLGFINRRQVLENLACADTTFVFYEPTNINNICSASNKLFEAMMIGVPVIINEETTQSKIVTDYKCGVVVRYGDIAALRRELVKLKNDPSLRKTLGLNGKKAFRENFAWEIVERNLINAYKSLLNH